MRPALKRWGAGAWQMGRPCLHPSPSFDMFTGNRVQKAVIQPCAIPAQAPQIPGDHQELGMAASLPGTEVLLVSEL